jgi:hypothetical protein
MKAKLDVSTHIFTVKRIYFETRYNKDSTDILLNSDINYLKELGFIIDEEKKIGYKFVELDKEFNTGDKIRIGHTLFRIGHKEFDFNKNYMHYSINEKIF